MRQFNVLRPQNIDEALKLFVRYQEQGCLFLAGGTDILPLCRKGALAPSFLIDLTNLGLNTIRQTSSAVSIGTACTFCQVERSRLVERFFPALKQAGAAVGCVQTRNLATIGGNICSAVPSADSAPALLIAEAKLTAVSPGGERLIELSDFFFSSRQSTLHPGELVKEIMLPYPHPQTRSVFLKIGRRRALSLAIVNTALSLQIDQGKMRQVRVAVGACSPIPQRLKQVEEYLEGLSYTAVNSEELELLVAGELSPIDDLRASAQYRNIAAAALIRRGLKQLYAIE